MLSIRHCLSFFFSFLLSVVGTPARYKWRRPVFYHLRNIVMWRWSFPVHRTHRKIALSYTDRSWNLQMRTVTDLDLSHVFS